MALPASSIPSADLDVNVGDLEAQAAEFAFDLASCIPLPPLPSLPALGFPLPPLVVPDLPALPGLPAFLTADPNDLLGELLAELVQELGLDIDTAVDLDVATLIAAIEHAAGEHRNVDIATVTSRLAELVLDVIPDAYVPPMPPLHGLPGLGIPLPPVPIPSVPLAFSLPKFLDVDPESVLRERLMELVSELGLDVDTSIDVSASTLVSAIIAAGEDLSAAEVTALQARIARVATEAAGDVAGAAFVPPIPPVPGLPALGVPLPPVPDLSIVLDLPCPLAKLSHWAGVGS